MPVESAADRLVFLNPDEFGVEAVYRTRTGSSATLDGVLNSGSIRVGFDRAVALDIKSTFVCRATDLPAGALGGDAGDTLTIDGTRYAVANVEPDGLGMTWLTLALDHDDDTDTATPSLDFSIAVNSQYLPLFEDI